MTSYDIISFKGNKLPFNYINLIYARWLRSLRFGNDYFNLINSKDYYSSYQKQISFLLQQPETTIKLAVLSDDHDVVLGFSISRGDILDYVHVHKDQRRQGIAKSLIPKEIKIITHLTKTALLVWPKSENITFNPFA